MKADGNSVLKFITTIAFATFLLLTLSNIGQSLWHDEAFTALLVSKNLPDMIQAIIGDNNPPLYYLILKPFVQVLGNSEFVLRSLSVFSSILSLFVLRKYISNKTLKELVSIFFLINTNVLYYSIEARLYSMFILFTIFSFFSSIKLAKESSTKNIILFIASNTLLLYVHTMALFCLSTNFLAFFYIIYSKKSLLKNWKRFLLFVIPIILFLPWLFVLLNQFGNHANYTFWLTFEPLESWKHLLGLIVYTRFYWGLDVQDQVFRAFASLMIFYLLFFFISFILVLKKHTIYVIPFVGLILMFFFSFYSPIFFYRYMIYLTPFVAITEAYGFYYLIFKQKYKFLFKILVVFIIIYSNICFLVTFPKMSRNPDFQYFKKPMSEYIDNGYTVYVEDDFMIFLAKYYYQNAKLIERPEAVNINIGISVFDNIDAIPFENIQENKLILMYRENTVYTEKFFDMGYEKINEFEKDGIRAVVMEKR